MLAAGEKNPINPVNPVRKIKKNNMFDLLIKSATVVDGTGGVLSASVHEK